MRWLSRLLSREVRDLYWELRDSRRDARMWQRLWAVRAVELALLRDEVQWRRRHLPAWREAHARALSMRERAEFAEGQQFAAMQLVADVCREVHRVRLAYGLARWRLTQANDELWQLRVQSEDDGYRIRALQHMVAAAVNAKYEGVPSQ